MTGYVDLIDVAARVAHEVNRAYCMSIGDASQPVWEAAPEWQKQSARDGVRHRLNNPDSTPEDSHQNWLACKVADGWIYGPVKDPALKQHPCMVPYAELPEAQQAKDHLFVSAVGAILKGMGLIPERTVH